ncbi:hypothetical protein ANCCEY_13640 [Ancylostoma ceylanicum]|uniref:Uncharacterized protein n=1 Tax=Ancylostoma ceylanicum TaxID=53326 RepID=A0A0D6L741_9BILA|nr:hypothetical protein ANCCEY_13640 [Ancylostoma ceylanicum]
MLKTQFKETLSWRIPQNPVIQKEGLINLGTLTPQTTSITHPPVNEPRPISVTTAKTPAITPEIPETSTPRRTTTTTTTKVPPTTKMIPTTTTTPKPTVPPTTTKPPVFIPPTGAGANINSKAHATYHYNKTISMSVIFVAPQVPSPNNLQPTEFALSLLQQQHRSQDLRLPQRFRERNH